jgi:single-stranded DNA-binding protein
MSINKAIVVGNLGRDPEVRALPSGQNVANFSVSTKARFKDRNGEQQERTEWHRIVAFGKLADNCQRLLSKGRQVYGVCVVAFIRNPRSDEQKLFEGHVQWAKAALHISFDTRDLRFKCDANRA